MTLYVDLGSTNLLLSPFLISNDVKLIQVDKLVVFVIREVEHG